MRIGIIAVGKLKAGPEKDLAARYLDRFTKTGPAIGLEFSRVVEASESRAQTSEMRKREEATFVEKSLPEGSGLILLDERGKSMGSEEFAHLLGDWRDRGKRDLMLAVGGPDGHDNALCQQADLLLCLGKMTWPHQLARILLIEQLYRAVTILSGHPYHRL